MKKRRSVSHRSIHKDIHRKHYKHKNRKRHISSKKKNAVIAVISFLFVFALVGLIAYGLEDRLSLLGFLRDRFSDPDDEQEEDEWEDNEITLYGKTYLMNHKVDTLLFMGTDYSGNEEGQGEDYVGSLSDFLMMMVIDHTDNTYAFLPIDRNTMTEVCLMRKDGSWETRELEQICTAHWYGGSKEMGCENTVTAVSDYLGGLPIDGYYAISMSEIPRINHEIGGVTVTLTDDFTKQDPEMKKGATLTLTDQQAEIFIRSRMSMADDTNKNRMDRQWLYLSGALKKIKSNLAKDAGYFERVSEDLSDAATSSITGRQTSRAANALAMYENMESFDIQGETKLGYELGDGVEHEEFYPDPDSVVQVMTDLYHLEPVEDTDPSKR